LKCGLQVVSLPFHPYITPAYFYEQHDHLFTQIFLNESFAEINRTDLWGGSDVHCCLYYDLDGTCEWTNWDSTTEGIYTDQRWDGVRDACILGGREFGMLLDLDEGTLSLYKQGRCLGVMMRGLTGEYCWVANILAQANGSTDEQNVRIERAAVPS
jgi:hypothetical protein